MRHQHCLNRLVCFLLQVASAPHPEDLNKEALFLCKGDIFAGETKQAREPTSTMVSFGWQIAYTEQRGFCYV
jgi:hypothetical protein